MNKGLRDKGARERWEREEEEVKCYSATPFM